MRFFPSYENQALMDACTQGLEGAIENMGRLSQYRDFAQALKISLNNLEALEHHSQQTPKPGR